MHTYLGSKTLDWWIEKLASFRCEIWLTLKINNHTCSSLCMQFFITSYSLKASKPPIQQIDLHNWAHHLSKCGNPVLSWYFAKVLLLPVGRTLHLCFAPVCNTCCIQCILCDIIYAVLALRFWLDALTILTGGLDILFQKKSHQVHKRCTQRKT